MPPNKSVILLLKVTRTLSAQNTTLIALKSTPFLDIKEEEEGEEEGEEAHRKSSQFTR